MRRIRLIILFLLGLSSFESCSVAKHTEGHKDEEYLLLKKKILNETEFSFEAEWVNSINLVTNTNLLRFSWNILEVDLPYFGHVHNSLGYSPTNINIVFKGNPENIRVTPIDSKKIISLTFKSQEPRVSRVYTMELYPNGKASLIISSTDREAIRYRGNYNFKPN